MKAYIGNYINTWTTYHTLHAYYHWRYDKWEPENPDRLDKVVKFILDSWQNTICRFVNKTWASRKRIIKIKLDRWDTWNVDNTLSHIIYPLLVQLKATQHGAPNVDDEDVPVELRSTEAPPTENPWDTDNFWFKRWDWVLDEMIWSFKQLSEGSDNFYHHISKDAEVPEGWQWVDGFKITEGFWVDRPSETAYHARIENGLRLFGKYYQSLWD